MLLFLPHPLPSIYTSAFKRGRQKWVCVHFSMWERERDSGKQTDPLCWCWSSKSYLWFIDTLPHVNALYIYLCQWGNCIIHFGVICKSVKNQLQMFLCSVMHSHQWFCPLKLTQHFYNLSLKCHPPSHEIWDSISSLLIKYSIIYHQLKCQQLWYGTCQTWNTGQKITDPVHF